MPLVKSRGNMYEFVTHCHSHLRGGCPHSCTYCYVRSFRNYERDWTGPVRLLEKELTVNYGMGKVIFIEHCNDLFAENVPDEYVSKILEHCNKHMCKYLFQTKNPKRMTAWYPDMPGDSIFGTTIETNRDLSAFSKAPSPKERYEAMMFFRRWRYEDTYHSSSGVRKATGEKLMVTIEPIMQFDLDVLSKWIIDIHPDFVNIGADSKHHGLPEPTRDEVLALVKVLEENSVHINKKTNLKRLVKNVA